MYDLSFGGPIKVTHKGQRVSAETRFLGSCIGHRAKVGPRVRIGYGEMIPNDTFIVADPVAGPQSEPGGREYCPSMEGWTSRPVQKSS